MVKCFVRSKGSFGQLNPDNYSPYMHIIAYFCKLYCVINRLSVEIPSPGMIIMQLVKTFNDRLVF